MVDSQVGPRGAGVALVAAHGVVPMGAGLTALCSPFRLARPGALMASASYCQSYTNFWFSLDQLLVFTIGLVFPSMQLRGCFFQVETGKVGRDRPG
jgi:hypothetical protein